jgi:transposase InsO family protein
VSLYRFIDAQKASYTIRLLCQVLVVPESSYFDWNASGRDRLAARDAERARRVGEIREVFDGSDQTYGSPRVHRELRNRGVKVSCRHVAELMAAHDIVGLSGREHCTTTTRRDRLAAPFPDLVERRFLPGRPDKVWYGDISYLWVADRFWYLATVIDAATKEVLGWAFADHLRSELICRALHAAVARRGGNVDGLIFHSDRGTQYTSSEYGAVCASYKIRQSMGRRGVCYDNAAAESFFATIKRELIRRYRWDDPKILEISLFKWIETWYNRRRLHSTIGYRTPAQAYASYMRGMRAG